MKAQDWKELMQILGGGIQQVRVVLRAPALLQLDAGGSAPNVSQTGGMAIGFERIPHLNVRRLPAVSTDCSAGHGRQNQNRRHQDSRHPDDARN
jgi:hypothetical protein